MEKELTAIYDSDSKRFHKFFIDGGQEIIGTIYIPKGKEIPERVTIQLKTKGEMVGRAS